MGVNITNSDIQTFQNSVGNHFVSTLRATSSCFCSQDLCQHSAYLILRKLLVWTLLSINSVAKVLWSDGSPSSCISQMLHRTNFDYP